jgi:HlyD family secretion protein
LDKKSLFRDKALKHLSSPEQLDQLIRIVTSRTWWFVIGLYILIVAFILWLFFGSVPTRVEGSGIILSGGAEIYKATAPDGPSRVDKILARPGDHVKKNQVVVQLSRPDLSDDILVAERAIKDLQAKYDKLSALSKTAISEHSEDLEKQKAFLKQALENNQKRLNNAEELLSVRQGAFEKGLEVRQNVNESLQQYYGIKSEIDDFNNKMADLEIREQTFIDQWQERLRDLELKIADAQITLANLEADQQLSTTVKSPIDGTVINLQATEGTIVQVGDALMNVASPGEGLDALAFFQPNQGKRIKVGMTSLVTPTTVEKAEFGSIQGKVVKTDPFPSTKESIESVLQNPELVKKFTDQEPPIAIRIHLDQDPNTFSGLSWSTSDGPKQIITPGTLAISMVTIRKQRPVTLIIPMFKKLVGVDY